MKRNTMCRLAALVLAIALLLSTAAVSADTVHGDRQPGSERQILH